MAARPDRRVGPARDDAGVSLVEVLVAMSLLLMILGFTVTTLINGMGKSRSAQVRADNTNTGKIALDRMTKALRVATTPVGEPAAFVTAGPREVEFYSSVGTRTGSAVSGPKKYRIWVHGTGATGLCRPNDLCESVTPATATVVSGATTYSWNPANTVTRILARQLAVPQTRPVFTYLKAGDATVQPDGTTLSSLGVDAGGLLTDVAMTQVDAVEIWLDIDHPSSPDVPPATIVNRVDVTHF
jgi:Tfp pilus assembly protein PilW